MVIEPQRRKDRKDFKINVTLRRLLSDKLNG